MCKFSNDCNYCHGYIDNPTTCARHGAAENVGINNVPADIGPIDYNKASLLKVGA